MDGEESIPVLVPLWTTATITRDLDPDSPDIPDWPLAILSIDAESGGHRIFEQMLAHTPDLLPEIRSEVWVDLPGQQRDAYSSEHAGHPLIRLWVGRTNEGLSSPRKELCFLVCVQCESSFISQCTWGSDHLGLMVAPTEDPEMPDDPVPPIVLASLDPTEVAFVELYAWRHAYDRQPPTEPERPPSRAR